MLTDSGLPCSASKLYVLPPRNHGNNENAFQTNMYFELGNFENIKVYFDHSSYSIRGVFHHTQVI